VPSSARQNDGVSGLNPTLRDDTEVEAGAMMGDKEIRHIRLPDSHADPKARDPRLGHLELRVADRVAVADADLVVAKPGDREVLAETARRQVGAPEKLAPIVIRLGLIDHHGPLFAAVAAEVTLSVAVDVQPAHHHRAGNRVFVDAGVHGLPAPSHIGWHSDIDGDQLRGGYAVR
jgi:hypothetical protein